MAKVLDGVVENKLYRRLLVRQFFLLICESQMNDQSSRYVVGVYVRSTHAARRSVVSKEWVYGGYTYINWD